MFDEIENRPKLKNEFAQQPCPVCGNGDFEWGTSYIFYSPGQKLSWMSMNGRNLKVASVRRCLTCGNILSFYDESLTKELVQQQVKTVIFVLLLVGAIVLVTLLLVFALIPT